MPTRLIVEPQKWIIECILNVITTIISIYIAKKELTTIRAGHAIYTTKYLKLWSVLCISCGPMIGLSYVVQSFDGFCFITWYLKNLLSWWCGVFMGMYQLSRLYYCFSQNQTHTHKGYPKWVYIFMFSLGTIFLIQDIQHPLSSGITTKCGLNDKYQYIEHKNYWYWLPENKILYLQILLWIIFLLWDFGTLFLYVIKIKSLQNNIENTDVNKRILAIMHRIVILTLFYEIPVLSMWWLFYLFGERQICSSIFFIISMYLMQQHNDKEYAKFIRCIYRSKLHYLCCCYKNVIVNQVMHIDIQPEKDSIEETTTNAVVSTTNYNNDGDGTIDTNMNFRISVYTGNTRKVTTSELTAPAHVNCI